MSLTRYGWQQWLTITVLLAIPSTFAIWFQWWFILTVICILWLLFVSFFRDPWRKIPTDLQSGTMLSPADGVVSAIEYVDSHEATKGQAIIIRIFLSVLNVHINRVPCDCTLTKTIYRKGKFLDARTEESAKVNESNQLMLDVRGETIGIRQVSGKIARNIVCKIRLGDALLQGQRFGMIKFGSTTELILPRPDDVIVHVTKGDKVWGGVTLIATLGAQS